MKISKKLRFLFSLTAFMTCLTLGSVFVYGDADVLPIEEETTLSAEDAKTYADGKITLGEAKSMVEQVVTAVSQISTASPDELDYIADVMGYQTDMYENFAKTVGEESAGAYVSHDDVTVEESEEQGKVNVITNLHFEHKDLKMVLHVSCFDTIGAQITSTEFSLADEGEQTFGDRMAEAGVNTLLGMGTVFAVLIFICLIISCFGWIPALISKLKKKETAPEDAQDTNVQITRDVVPVAEEDNSELIAVIAAAIAASEQTSTDSFVVRSIRRR